MTGPGGEYRIFNVTTTGAVAFSGLTISNGLPPNGTVSGGGIQNLQGGTVNVTNSTISGNIASDTGGILNHGSTVTVKSSIIASNAGSTPDVSGSFTSSGFNLVGKTDGGAGFAAPTDQTGTVALPLDPKLDSNGLQNNGGLTETVALLFGSPAINTGTSSGLTGLLTTDQRGAPRVVGAGCDIGAFELPEPAASLGALAALLALGALPRCRRRGWRRSA